MPAESDALSGAMSEATVEQDVRAHYHTFDIIPTLETVLRAQQIDPERVTVEQLAPFDNLHHYGVSGTLELARLATIQADDRILDVGGGVGGPARLLASRLGCSITVLDLSPDFCAAGETLTTWTHLTDCVSFVCASALDMPFADGSFDVALTQHATMNIADKARLYAEIHRVLRPGGRFALFDWLAGPNQPLHFPMPWSEDASYSFLLTPAEMRALITSAGFTEVAWLEGPELVAMLKAGSPPAPAQTLADGSPMGPVIFMGATARDKMANTERNIKEGRLVLAMGVFQRI